MRNYGKLQCTFWTDSAVRNLGCESRLLLAYLITGPHSNALGAYRMPILYLAEDLRWTQDKAIERINELIESGWIVYEAHTKWVCIPKFLKWNYPDNESVAKHMVGLFEEIPSDSKLPCYLVDSLLLHVDKWANRLDLAPLNEAKRRCAEGLDTQKKRKNTVSTPSRHPVETLATPINNDKMRQIVSKTPCRHPVDLRNQNQNQNQNLNLEESCPTESGCPDEASRIKSAPSPADDCSSKTMNAVAVSKQGAHALVKTFFEEVFWPNYPRREKKADALNAMLKLNPAAELQADIMAGLARAKRCRQWQRDEGQYIPLAGTWIRAEQWTDEYEIDMPTEPKRMTSEQKRQEAIRGALALTSGKVYEH